MDSQGAAEPRILTPDQRPRIFVSSTLQELAPERAAARAAIERLRLIPVMFELGARPHAARSLYRAYLAQSHVFVGLYFESYGWISPDESISGLEDEYRLSAALPRLVYIRAPAPKREPRLTELLDRVRSDDAVTYKSFTSPEELESLLAEDLAVLMGERFLLGRTMSDNGSGARSGPTPSRPLPTPVDSLVGRQAELDALEGLLRTEHRLVSVVGPGGIGKSRLALEVARRAASDPEHRIEFVPLDSIDDPDQVLAAVAATIGLGRDGGIPVLDALASAFGDRPVLLFLDNFEHVLSAAPDVAALLSRCPNLVVLVTSRASLRVRGETLLTLGPLSLPTDDGSIEGSAAVALFVERATAVRPDFSLDDPDDVRAVAELCRRLEGSPLAIELAAGRSRLLPPRILLQRLGSALDLSSGPTDLPARQRTLRDTVAWSEQLLEPAQRSLLAALSVFSAPWTVADAECVAPDGGGDVLDSVAALVENSLVTTSASSPGEPRFRLFDTVRAFAAERLDDAAGRDAAEQGFYACMLDQVPAYLDGILSPDQARWRSEFRLVWPDLRRAWAMAVDRRDAERTAMAARLVTALWIDGRNGEVKELLARSVRLGAETPTTGYGDLVLAASQSAFYLGEYDRSGELLAQFQSGAAPLPEGPLAAGAMALLRGYLAAGAGDVEAAERALGEAALLPAQVGPGSPYATSWVSAFANNGLGSIQLLRGDVHGARERYEESRRLAELSGNVGAQTLSLAFIAGLAVADGELDQARALLLEAVPLIEQQPLYEGNSYALEAAASLAASRGRPSDGARALGLARTLRDVNGAILWSLLTKVSDEVHEGVRRALGSEAFEATYAEGRRIDPRAVASMVHQVAQPR